MADEPAPTQTNSGKTIGDVFDGILTSPKRWLSLIGLLAALCALGLTVATVITRIFGVETKEIRFGSTDSHVLFASVDKKSGASEYVVVVNPEGWQQTTVEVRQGDRVSFHANGKICIDIHDVMQKVENRLRYEDEWSQKLNIKRDDPDEKRIPEDYFTEEQKRSLIPNRPWVDPAGFDLSRFQPSFRSRRQRYLLPEENAGALVAAVGSGTERSPARADAFVVGRSREDYAIGHSGRLWFTVNDVQYGDPRNPNLFYNDNVGSFWVTISIKRE